MQTRGSDSREDCYNSRVKRVAVMMGACLLIGAIINIAVAWGVAVRPDPLARSSPSDQERIEIFRCPWGADDKFLTIAPGERTIRSQRHALGFYLIDMLDWDEFERLLPKWSAIRRGRAPLTEIESAYSHVEFASGWPLLALRYEIWPDQIWGNSKESLHSIGLLTIPDSLVGNDQRTLMFSDDTRRTNLPMRPIAAGFFINTVLYAMAVWIAFIGLWWLPLRGRRMFRAWYGQCLHCAYDLRGVRHTHCPECGMAVHTQQTGTKKPA
jgi:hypothetical protein